jgi:hypothetical protein
MGGYLGRKNDPPPGHQLIWYGLRTFSSCVKDSRSEAVDTAPEQLMDKGQG